MSVENIAIVLFPSRGAALFVSNSIRDGRTDERTNVCLFVSVRCVCHGRPSYGGTNRNASIKN